MRFLIKKTPDNFIKSVNDEIATILNRHFDNFYPGYDYDEMSDKQTMPLEIRDKKQEYDIRAELPGVKKEDLDIDLNDNYLQSEQHKHKKKPKKINHIQNQSSATANFQEPYIYLQKLMPIKLMQN